MEKIIKPNYGPPRVEDVDLIIQEFVLRINALERGKELFKDEMNTKIVDFAASRISSAAKDREEVHRRTKQRVAELGHLNNVDVSKALELLEHMG
jgi:hypothetical protein